MIQMGLQLKICINCNPMSKTNRAPFDLTTEAESELISGFNVEYAAGPFIIFFLEYAIIMNIFTTILFLGAFHNPRILELYTTNFIIKTLLLTVFSL
ncbi:hypothetical protein EI555_011683 [Monodon monoceros]|uniref:NADH-ubiquinone oxidoreductase chain 1 n=1 Tax=Monodon monoceros TaxID=40151 RepID=A0A4U1FB09_MONMO|nr:hypothetical protein EI555_011683 [Monodon monoceros]